MGEGSSGNSTGKTIVIWFVRFLKGLAVLSLLLFVVAQCFVMKVSIESNVDDLEKGFTVLAGAGYCIFAFILIIAEFEPIWFIKYVRGMHYWFVRGLCHIWMGVILITNTKTLVSAVHANGGGDTDFLNTFGQVMGGILIAVGGIFCLMSLLCIRKITGQDDDLEERLLKASEGDLSKADQDRAHADALLIANLAIASGMTESDARKKLGGPNGAREASSMAKKRSEELKSAAQGKLTSAAADAKKRGSMVNESMRGDTSINVPPPGEDSSRGGGGGGSRRQSMRHDEPPSTFGGSRDDKKDDWETKRGPDDDELMRMYYGGGNKGDDK